MSILDAIRRITPKIYIYIYIYIWSNIIREEENASSRISHVIPAWTDLLHVEIT